MRILAMINSDQGGVMTEAGKITLGGTIGLIFFASLFAAIPGGLLYLFLRRWLPGSGAWKGFAYGVLLFCVFGSVVLEGDNPDFALFGPRPLAVFLFAILFPLYGVLLSNIVERFLSPVQYGDCHQISRNLSPAGIAAGPC